MTAEGFAAIPNWMVRDESISLHALMVYTALASHTGPGGVRPSQSKLAKEARCSERQVRYAIEELRALEVVEVVRRRRGEGKSTTLTNGYVLHPHGRLAVDEERDEVPASPAGTSGKLPAQGDEATGTETQIAPLIEEEPLKKKPESAFDEFWKVYPRHVARAAALKAFLGQARKVDPAVIVEGARRFVAGGLPEEVRFIPHAATWLNQGRWEDAPEVGPGVPVRSVDESRERWLAERGVTFEEYLERKDESGWLASLEKRVRRAS